ncbi:hypothetical protein P8452_14351 [Trifolium repens]|nr:hypothetical protein P8452_14351 [Trifolium repens]
MNVITTTCTKQRTTAPTNHKIWDGYLQMNNALLFSTIAYFKCGEKMPDVKWPQVVQLNGNVKLHDFEKYIQDLTRSCNRGLMVVSLYWKRGISEVALQGIKKVTKRYVEDGRVGVAKFKAGFDLYVCPRNDTIITILAKNGFINGKKAIEENKHSFIGCVVWRKNKINNPNSVLPKSSEKNDPIKKVSLTRLPLESSRKNYLSISSSIHMHSESWRNYYDQIPEELLSPIRHPIILPSESSRKNDHSGSSSIHMHSESWRNYAQNPEELLSPIHDPICLPSESSRKVDHRASYLIHLHSESCINYDQIPEELLSPIRHPIILPSE